MMLQPRKGQVLPLVVLMLPILVGMAGLALDTANLLARRDAAQEAADLAALGATGDLPSSASNARASALRFAASNGHRNGVNRVGVTVTTPYQSDDYRVKVTVVDTVPIMFMRMLGFRNVAITANAVATAGSPLQAIFASGNCGGSAPSGATWNASGSTITGQVHTNGNLSIVASGTTFGGPESYVCTKSITVAGGSVPAPTQVAAQTPPVPYRRSTFQPCTFSFTGNIDLSANGAWWMSGLASSKRLVSGTYCSTGSINLSGSGIQGTVTFAAATTVSITASTFSLQPYMDNVLVYADGSGTSSITSSGGSWRGILDAPNGTISLTSSGSWMLSGSILASAVTVNGSGMNLNSTALSVPKPTLVE